MMNKSNNSRLRAATFLVPSIPVEFFEGILNYLEKKIHLSTTLIYDSRWDRLPNEKLQLFQENEIDLAWLSSTAYIDLLGNDSDSAVKILPISSIHKHPKSKDKLGIYSDVILHKNFKESAKTLEDLRGCNWAYQKNKNLFGYNVTVDRLKKLGENASFFGNLIPSISHLDSVKMVMNKKVDAAAVDANCLALYLKNNDFAMDQVHVLTSWGPLTCYVMIVRNNLPEKIQSEIQSSLLKMHEDDLGREILSIFDVTRFVNYDPDQMLQIENDIDKNVRNMSFDPTYY